MPNALPVLNQLKDYACCWIMHCNSPGVATPHELRRLLVFLHTDYWAVVMKQLQETKWSAKKTLWFHLCLTVC